MADEKRPKQTAKEKAEQAVEVAQRKVDRLKERRDDLAARGEAVVADLTAAEKNLEYLKQHPALTQETAPTAPSASDGEGDTPPAPQDGKLGDF